MAESMMKEAISSAVHALQLENSGDYGERPTDGRVDRTSLARILDAWTDKPRQVADQMIQQYGEPHEATASRLIWFNSGPWKRTIVYRDEVPHNFPKPHTDLLEQFIDLEVPVQAFSDLAAFDGSVIPERTKGEISARCDMEPMNFLALNLAYDIISGKRSVDDARKTYAEVATAFMSGDPSPYVEELTFDPPRAGTADADEITPGPMIDEMMQQARAMLSGDGGRA